MGQRQDNQLKQQLAQFWQDQKQDIEALCRDEKKSCVYSPTTPPEYYALGSTSRHVHLRPES